MQNVFQVILHAFEQYFNYPPCTQDSVRLMSFDRYVNHRFQPALASETHWCTPFVGSFGSLCGSRISPRHLMGRGSLFPVAVGTARLWKVNTFCSPGQWRGELRL